MPEVPRESRLSPIGDRAESGLTRRVSEDHLGVALIQPGGSRYEQMKVAEGTARDRAECKKGGTAFMMRDVPCNRNIAGDFLMCLLKEEIAAYSAAEWRKT